MFPSLTTLMSSTVIDFSGTYTTVMNNTTEDTWTTGKPEQHSTGKPDQNKWQKETVLLLVHMTELYNVMFRI